MDQYEGGKAYEQGSGGLARTAQLVAAEYLLTVNPVDGSEIEPCPPVERPGRPEKLDPDERPAPHVPPRLPGARAAVHIPLLEREEERERLGRLLSRGRSVRLTGPSGAGRSALLDAVAEDVDELAPDGVVRLSGYHRTPSDLLHDLFSAVHHAPLHRPGRAELDEALATVGAVVVVDDLEFGGAALDELLQATPECAFLLATTPDIAAPSADAHVEEVFLAGISRTACLELLEHAVNRPLTDEEADWAADLWFDSEGLALRFVQAGALLRDQGRPPAASTGAALVPAAVAGLSGNARQALRFALALDGELPHHSHLPALTGDPHADEAVAELADAGLITLAGAHHRLAAGVAEQLAESDAAADARSTGSGGDAGPSDSAADGTAACALAAAQHYAWWTGHPSVSPERAAAESDAILAAVRGAQRAGHASTAVLLARTAAPVLAAGLRWSAWERVLRAGQEAARLSGEVAEEAYFHHELGVLALSTGQPERARAELEASLGLRGTLAEQRGVVAGRRALTLVSDRLGEHETAVVPPAPSGLSQSQTGAVRPPEAAEESTPPPAPAIPQTVISPPATTSSSAAVTASVPGASSSRRRLAFHGSKRNVLAASAGALLAAVLGTIVTLGTTSGDGGEPDTVKPEQSASQGEGGDGLNADKPASTTGGSTTRSQQPAAGTTPPASPERPSATRETSESPEQPPSSSDASPSRPTDPPTKPTDPPTKPTDPPTKPTDPPTKPTDPPTKPTDDPSPSDTDDPPTEGSPSGSGPGSGSGSGSGSAAV
ncbi:ATP-binding protein [Streptomyces sp. NPDC048172]|uniref:ATP-binding protein n=1 Tax=Streptomyces sp. NPDC048172 TaxID=3365505 RepID=UPI00371B0B70